MVSLSFLQFISLSVWFTIGDADETVVIEPSRLVVEYGAKASANCSISISHKGMGWEASQGAVDMVENIQLLTWTVPKLIHWDIHPLCFVNLENRKQIYKSLTVVVYKIPDSVSISFKDCSGPVIEGESCLLQCDITNVAPVQSVNVMWYKQQFLINTSTIIKESITPTDTSVTLMVQPNRNDDGAKYWCEAKLELGPEGPQHSPTKKSDPLQIRVHYKPVFSNDTEILEIGDEEMILNCTAMANPPAKYTLGAPHLEKEVLLPTPTYSITRSGSYICTASNRYGEAKKKFIIKYKYHDPTVFWIFLGTGLCLAVLLIISYLIKKIYKRSANHNYTPSPVQTEETKAFQLNKL